MDDDRIEGDVTPGSQRRPDSLRTVSAGARWTAPAAVVGIALLALAIVLAFVAPSPTWFLLYPLLVVGSIGALATVVVWMLRHF